MIYGPDDKPIVNPVVKAMNATMQKWYNRTTLEALQKKFCFTDWWGPTLYDARGNRIEWPGRPMVPVKTGRTIQFFRKMDPMDAESCFCGKTTREDAKKEGFSCCKAAGFIVAQSPDGRIMVGHEMDNLARPNLPPRPPDEEGSMTAAEMNEWYYGVRCVGCGCLWFHEEHKAGCSVKARIDLVIWHARQHRWGQKQGQYRDCGVSNGTVSN